MLFPDGVDGLDVLEDVTVVSDIEEEESLEDLLVEEEDAHH